MFREQDLNSEPRQCDVMYQPIGMPCAPPPSPVICQQSRQIFSFGIILPCREYLPTIQAHCRLYVSAWCTGVVQVLARVDRPGMKRAWTLTLKIQEPNGNVTLILGGAVTEVRNVLSLMNFEEQSIFPMSSAGLTGTRSVWRLREEADLYLRNESGSLPMWIPVHGTQN